MSTSYLTFCGLFFILFMAFGCISPVNMVYENAELLEPKSISITGAYGFSEELTEEQEFSSNLIPNHMVRLGFGAADFLSLYGTWQRKSARGRIPLIPFLTDDYAVAQFDYFELAAKFPLIEEVLAFKTSYGRYYVDKEMVAQAMYGAFLFSSDLSNNCELYFAMHGTGIYERNGLQLLPGANLGLGISSDLDRWAIRPEIGCNLRTYTLGIGLSFKIGKKVLVE